MGKWKNEKVGKLGYTYTGLSGKSAEDFGKGAPYIPYMNVFTNSIVDGEFIEYVEVGNYEKQNEVKLGDVLFTTSSETPEEVGMSSVLTEDFGTLYLNSFCFGYRLYNKGDFNSTFLAYLLRSNSVRHQMFIWAQGSTRHNLSKKNFNMTEVFYPEDVKEQSKIAEILFIVDEAINKTSGLIQKYKNVKAGMMQDLLGNGEEVEFEKIIKTYFDYRGRTPKKLGMEWGNGDIPALSANNVQMGEIDLLKPTNYGSPALYKRWMTHGDLKPGYLLFTMEAPLGNVAQIKDDQLYILSQRTIAIDCNSEYCTNDFLYHYLMSEEFQRYVALYSSGTTAKGIQRKQLFKLRLKIPKDIGEQNKIVEQLTAIDEKIQTERDYLIKLHDIKRGLMQDLMTNTVSVDALL